MAWTDYHTHCDFCDGAERPLAYVEAALDREVVALGFSSHAPLPFPAPWCIGRGQWPSTIERYRTEIESLKRVYRGRLSVWVGLEVDYIPGLVGPADAAFASFDYRIGAVHFVGRTREGLPWQMDDTPQSFEHGLEELYGGDIRTLVEAYFRALGEMAWLERPDIVAHFDLVKKYNAGGRYFDEGETWYRSLAEEALRVVARSGCILELNTGGMARGWTDEPYPSPWLLSRCRDLGIPMTLDSDCHRGADVAFAFREAASVLAGAGYAELMTLGREGWRPTGFDRRGLCLGSTRVAA